MWPRFVTKMFAGLMSRWTTPSACAASRPSAIWMAKSSTVSISIGRATDAVFQRRTVQILHDYEDLSVLVANFVDGADVRVI